MTIDADVIKWLTGEICQDISVSAPAARNCTSNDHPGIDERRPPSRNSRPQPRPAQRNDGRYSASRWPACWRSSACSGRRLLLCDAAGDPADRGSALANSDDLKVVQGLTQALAHTRKAAWSGCARCRPMARFASAQPARTKAKPTSRHHRSGDPRCPEERAGSGNAAQERRGAVGCLRQARPEAKEGRAKHPENRPTRRTPRSAWSARTKANVNLLKVILQQYGVDPAKVEVIQFPANEAAEAISSQKADAYLAAGPVNSKITADAIAASARDGGTPTFLAIDLGGGDRAEPSCLRGI